MALVVKRKEASELSTLYPMTDAIISLPLLTGAGSAERLDRSIMECNR